MTIFVADCSHWIGFHITSALLNAGKLVDGARTDKKEEDLSMFFARNSNFSFAEGKSKKLYEAAILIGDPYENVNIHAKHLFIIQPSSKDFVSNRKDNTTFIDAPLLFGDQMPMNEEGTYENGKFIPFDSAYFRDEAIYIEDFTKALMQWMNSTLLRNKLKLKSSKSKESYDEHTIYIRMTKSIETRLQEIFV